VLSIAVEELKGRVPVRAMGREPKMIDEMVEFVQSAERANVDGAQVFSLDMGHGVKPTMGEMDTYYSTVLGSVSMPLYLSSHMFAGYFLPIDLVESLVSRFPNLAGIMWAGTDITHLAELIRRVGDRIEVYCAGPTNAISALALGANGFMGGEGNFMPSLVASVITAWKARDHEGLRESFGKLMALTAINNRFGGSAMRGMKPLMSAFGFPAGKLRLPRMPITQTELDGMIDVVLKLNIPGTPPLASRA
jgi:4-hydroxy-tetrahydrodipicolinate synthase